jgi:hypothetical protein
MDYIRRPVLGTAALLLIPFFSMQFALGGPEAFNWTLSDFVVAGILLLTTGLLLEAVWRNAGKYRALAIGGIMFLFLWLWAELAVGIFTNWGS